MSEALVPELVVEAPQSRVDYVRTRLISINKHASDLVLENGLLLREYRMGAYFKAQGYPSFDVAVTDMQQKGDLDYGPRQARNFIAIVDMVEAQGLEPEQIRNIGISKLREVASVPETDQVKLLEASKDMSVAEVQKEAKRIRDKAAGRDTDPWDVFVLKTTETQKAFLTECLSEARRVYAIDDAVSDTAVLIDGILADWHSALPDIEAQQIEASQ